MTAGKEGPSVDLLHSNLLLLSHNHTNRGSGATRPPAKKRRFVDKPSKIETRRERLF